MGLDSFWVAIALRGDPPRGERGMESGESLEGAQYNDPSATPLPEASPETRSPVSNDPAPDRTPWMHGECCRGVPAALQPVLTGSHGPCVTVCVDCAAAGPAVDVSSTS